MGTGVALAIGLLAERLKAEGKRPTLVLVTLITAVGMMAVGLLFSYSRGAWVGTAIGLLFLAKAYDKFKWRWILPPVLVVGALIFFSGITLQTMRHGI